MKTVKSLGTVELTGTVVVSDPCYDRDVWCMQTGSPVKPGRYEALALYSDEEDWGNRVANLVLVHEDHRGAPPKAWKPIESTIGVDSGQCGIFDDSIYPEEKDHTGRDTFYDECCSITLAKGNAGILRNGKGVVSSSGYGDGSYELYAKSDGEQYVALMVDYCLLKMRKVMEILAARQSGGTGDE